MPEIGLLPFARVAMEVATAFLPTYRSRFSKHQFTQPQLLAILCLMRYADGTCREAELLLREHSELRAVLRLLSMPDHTIVYRFLQRLPYDTMDHMLGESVRRLRRSLRRGIPEGEIRYQLHRAYPRQLYGPRAKIETVCSVIQRKLSAKAPGHRLPMQTGQLCCSDWPLTSSG